MRLWQRPGSVSLPGLFISRALSGLLLSFYELYQLVRRHRPGVIESLDPVCSHPDQHIRLPVCFRAFGHDLHAHIVE